MRRFFVDPSGGQAATIGARVTLDRDESRHLRTVLRLAVGAAVQLTDGQGHAFDGVLVGCERDRAEVEITAIGWAAAELASPRLHLACAVVKGRRFEYALEKAVELGAHAITPLITERGVIAPRAGRRDRWHGLLVSALKQSGRCLLPELGEATALARVLDQAGGPCHVAAAPGDLVAETPLDATQLAAQAQRLLLQGAVPPEELLVLVGPEGGWSPTELAMLMQAQAVPLTLGSHVLRTETAAVVALAALDQIRRAWRRRSA